MTIAKRAEFLPVSRPTLCADELTRVTEVLQSGWWTTGPACQQFEKALSTYLGRDGHTVHSVGVNSCTAALHVALLALGVGPGDEVIVPTWTFASTAHVVEWVGATPVLCDVEGDAFNLDVKACAALCTPRTKAIIPVHMAGFPYRMEELAELARQRGLRIIEDAAHAIGTEYNGQRIGTFSDVTCFSFYATKNLAMGEGGAAVTADPALADAMRRFAYLGIDKDAFKRYEKSGTWRYDVAQLGYKYNLDSVHATLGLVQLEHLDAMNARRRQLAARYAQKLPSSITPSHNDPRHYHVHHIYPVLLPLTMDRDDVALSLKEWNIGTSVHFIPLHLHSHYAHHASAGSFPVAEALFARVLSLPMWAGMHEDDVDYVCAVLESMVR